MNKPAKDLELAELIKECQKQTKQSYGYRRVTIWLERNGIHHNPKTVLSVMRKYNLLSVIRRKRYYKCSQALHKYQNLLNRDFQADRPNQKKMGALPKILCKNKTNQPNGYILKKKTSKRKKDIIKDKPQNNRRNKKWVRKNSKNTAGNKQTIVNLYHSGKTYAQIHKEYGVSSSALSNWVRKYSEVKIDDSTVLTANQVRELQKRCAQLEEENLILKKAIAIFTPHSDKD